MVRVALIGTLGRIGNLVDFELAIDQVNDPIGRDSRAGVEAQLGRSVESEGAIGNLADHGDVSWPRVTLLVVILGAGHEGQVRLRFSGTAQGNGKLRAQVIAMLLRDAQLSLEAGYAHGVGR